MSSRNLYRSAVGHPTDNAKGIGWIAVFYLSACGEREIRLFKTKFVTGRKIIFKRSKDV